MQGKVCQLTCKYVCEIKGKQQFITDCNLTLGFPSKIQHTGSKQFKMGIYENTFWAHLKHIQWCGPLHHGTHIVPCIQSMVCWCTQVPWCTLTARISVRPFWLVVDFDATIWSWKPKSKHRRNVSLSGKSGQTMAPTWSENINLASRGHHDAHSNDNGI